MAKLVCYEPCAQSPSEGFMKCLNSFGCPAEVIRNCWLIETDQCCVAIRDALKPHTSPGDRLFVVACCKEAAWAGKMLSPSSTIQRILNCSSC